MNEIKYFVIKYFIKTKERENTKENNIFSIWYKKSSAEEKPKGKRQQLINKTPITAIINAKIWCLKSFLFNIR